MMASTTLLLLLKLFLVMQYSSADTFFDHSQTEYYDTVHLRDVTPKDLRKKRSAEEMPDHLHFDFQTGSHLVSLRLKRSENIVVKNLPVYSVGDDQRLKGVDLPAPEDTAVYRDIQNKAAVLVRKFVTGLQLHGSLQIGGKDIIISPNKTQHNMTHVLHAAMVTGVFGVDQIYPLDILERVLSGLTRKGASIHPRRRRATKNQRVDKHNVQINLVCDYGCYTSFLARKGNNKTLAFNDAKLYYSYLAQAIDIRYRAISSRRPEVLITVTPLSVVVATTAKGAEYSEKNRVGEKYVNGNKAITDFGLWAAGADLMPSATNILITGYDMVTDGDISRKGQLGVAYTGHSCSYTGTAVIEEQFHSKTAMIAAHELGHTLNSRHDGFYANNNDNCDDNDPRYVMSAIIGFPIGSSNPWTFSPCSADAIVQYIKDHSSCFPGNDEDKVPDDEGQVYNADAQCSFALREQAYLCRRRQIVEYGYDGLCSRMYCGTKPTDDKTCQPIVAREFTSCGNQKWCVRGQCVRDKKAPVKPSDRCAQGDDPTYGCRPSMCADNSAQIYCCETCAKTLKQEKPKQKKIQKIK